MSNDFPKSNTFKNWWDFKKLMLRSFGKTLRSRKEKGAFDADTQVTILTNFGTVYADFLESGDLTSNKDLPLTDMYVQFKQALDQSLFAAEGEEGETDIKVVVPSGAICLVNAVVVPYANLAKPMKYPELILYSDQIAGVTFSKVPKL